MVSNELIPTSGVDVLTAGVGQSLATVLVVVGNYHASNSANVDIHVIKSGDSPADKNKIIAARPIPSGDSLFLDQCKFLLSAGDKIRAVASANNVLNITVSYITI